MQRRSSVTETKTTSILPRTPTNIEIGDIIVVRYKESRWANILSWEDWHHAALVSKINPLTVIEAVGGNTLGQHEGPTEVIFTEAAGFGKQSNNIVKLKFLKPVFPDPIREIADRDVPRDQRKILTEPEARQRVVEYARAQIGEPYKLANRLDLKNLITAWQMSDTKTDLLANDAATKWDENEWYCSLLVYKSFSRTITDMYLEAYNTDLPPDIARATMRTGFFVTPEDLVDSRRTEVYFTWAKFTEVPPEANRA